MKTFHYVFQLSKKIVFEVNYYKLGMNPKKHFATSASKFNQPKTDYEQCGQAQKSLCTQEAKEFYLKWDFLHTTSVSDLQYSQIIADLEILKGRYNFIYSENNEFGFMDIKELSKLTPKKLKNS